MLVVLPLGIPAHASQTDRGSGRATNALSQFEAHLNESGSLADQRAYAELTEFQKQELANYLLGENSSEVVTKTAITEETVPAKQGKANTAAAAASSTKTISGNQWTYIGKLKISETRVRGVYTVAKGKVKKTNSYSCTVVKNIDPFAKVSSTKAGAYVSGGNATFECKVTVKRGVPTPWGPISWSQKQAVQQVKGNAKGKVVSHKWV